jgi:hypothetical protein
MTETLIRTLTSTPGWTTTDYLTYCKSYPKVILVVDAAEFKEISESEDSQELFEKRKLYFVEILCEQWKNNHNSISKKQYVID